MELTRVKAFSPASHLWEWRGFFLPEEGTVSMNSRSGVPLPGPPKDRVTVLIDYENIVRTADRAFSPGDGNSHILPRRLAELIVQRRRGPSRLHEVRVYRGQPNPHRQPVSASANNRQAAEWETSGVKVVRRNLKYPNEWPEQPAKEKGIDVALAVDAVRLAALRETDVVIVFSHDNDLLPAIETVLELPNCHVEVAAWSGCNRLRLAKTQVPWCHWISELDFGNVRDPTEHAINPG